jgi:succinyl-diaminopimelate desuccinylase
LVQFASELIRIPSENPPGNAYSQCGKLITHWLRDLGLKVHTVNPSADAPCVIGTWGGEGRALYFSGHYDVVPAQAQSQFNPVLRKANLHGRGAADMKGGVAAMASAIRALGACGFEPKGRIISVSVPDEETSGPRGTVALAKAGLLERDAIGMLTWNRRVASSGTRIAVCSPSV